MRGPVAIVGYMGSGKSSIGRFLARDLGWKFVDLDRAIEQKTALKIPEIFARFGEEHFRNLEHQALLEALDGQPNQVVACGGGTVVRHENREKLKGVKTVFLQEDAGVLYRRTRKPGRPLRGGGYDEFARRYADRLPLYREVADLEIPTNNRPKRQIIGEILRWLEE